MHCPITQESLNAYVDGELTPDAALAVSDHLATCARCSTEYNAVLTTVAALRGGLERYRAPDVLRARVRAAIASRADEPAPVTTPPTRRRMPWARASALAAAAVVCVALGSGATLLAGKRSTGMTRIEAEVFASHVRSLMPDHLTDVHSSDQHNVKPWFNGRLDFSPNVTRLDDEGFPLIGGRLDYIGDRPVAAIVYGRRQHIINVFSWPADGGDAPMTSTSSHGYTMLQWRSGGYERWIVSDVNAGELHAFADLLRRAEVATPQPARR